jgi:hypothetical protein
MPNRASALLLLFLASTAATLAQYNAPPAKQGNPAILSQPTCPWLTAGSAARALGGDVSVSISTTNNNDGSCKFLKLQDSRDSLQIQVGKGSLTGCPGEHTNLVGIGNEAAECRLPGSHGETVEMVNSRVRDVHFNVILTIFKQETLPKSPNEREVPVEQIAEQIAGNLY